MSNKKNTKNNLAGFFKENTEVVKINGKDVRVFSQEAEKLKAKLAKKSKK